MAKLAVIGYPVAHSRSPAMQEAALTELGLLDWSYGAIEVPPEHFEARVGELVEQGYLGANVTIPHKEAALALADVSSEPAREIGAANTLVFAGGAVEAHNTDAGGLLAALPATPLDARTLVLGAGGAARGAVWALVGEGARVEVWNRTAERAADLCAELGGRAVEAPDAPTYDLIVNTTSVGLAGEDPFELLPLDSSSFVPGQVVIDMVYGGEPTALLRAAEAAGATVIDGLEVLVQQGALSLEIWTGRKPPLDIMRAAARSNRRR